MQEFLFWASVPTIVSLLAGGLMAIELVRPFL